MDLGRYVDAAIASCKTGLMAELLALNPALPVPIADDAPEGDYYYGGQETISRYPAVEIAAPDAEITDFSIGQGSARVEPAVYVVIHHQHADFKSLGQQLARYADAVRKVMLRPDAFGPHIPVMRVSVRYRYADPEARDYVGITGTTIQQFRLEDYI